MNRFNTTNNGGLPILLDDFRFMDSATREAIRGMFSAFSNMTQADSFIISGCVITGTITRTCSAGFIFFEGEICYVEAHTLPTLTVGQSWYWGIVETVDSSGTRIMRDTTVADCYILRRAKVFGGTPPVSFMAVDSSTYSTPRLHDKLVDSIQITNYFAEKNKEEWRSVGTSGNPAFQSSWVNVGSFGHDLQFKADGMGNIIIRGYIQGGLVGPANTIFTLPAGYIPSENMSFLLDCTDGGSTNTPVRLVIYSDGRVVAHSFITTSTTTTPKINFGGTRYAL
jgi:hypothetical protein